MSDKMDINMESSPTSHSFGSHSWTKQDYLLASLTVMIKIGDGVEAYLPGVITQKVSCELGVSELQEAILAVIMFFFWTIAITVSVPISERMGERFTLLLSLYMSIAFTILCAVVPNYYTLLLSRALIGICIGLNDCATGIFIAKLASSKEIVTQCSFLAEALGFAAGGTWVSLLGWLTLDLVSWRVFVLMTSIPLFVPPIIMLHFFKFEKPEEIEGEKSESVPGIKFIPSETDGLVEKKSQNIPNFNYSRRVIKSSLFFFCNLCVGYGSIILLPSLLRKYKSSLPHHSGKCEEVVQGNDFLVLAAVTGAANTIGRPLGYFLWTRVKFIILQPTITIMMAVCFGVTITNPGLTTSVALLGLAKLCYSIQAVEASIMIFDCDYYGKSGFEFGSAVTMVSGQVGSVVGTSTAAFLDPHIAVSVTLVVLCVELVVIGFMRERF